MSERIDLQLAPSSDLWRRHGLLNVFITLGMPLCGLVLAVVIFVTGTFGVPSALI